MDKINDTDLGGRNNQRKITATKLRDGVSILSCLDICDFVCSPLFSGKGCLRIYTVTCILAFVHQCLVNSVFKPRYIYFLF